MSDNIVNASEGAFDPVWKDQVFEDLPSSDRQFLDRVIAWVEPIIKDQILLTQESAIHHVKGMLTVLSLLDLDATTMAAAMISAAAIDKDALSSSRYKTEIIDKFGLEVFELVEGSRALIHIGWVVGQALHQSPDEEKLKQEELQEEMLRKMLLAMATDLRIVLIRLAARLQTLRWFAESKLPCPVEIALQTSKIYAPLANRLGIWQIKWEM